MRQFNLRAILIAMAATCALFAFAAPYIRADVFTMGIWIWLAATLTGSLAGTIYGAVLARPETNRWLRAFAVGSLAGAMAFIVAFPPPRSLFLGIWWLTGLVFSTIPGCFAASVWEATRLAIARFAKTDTKAAGNTSTRNA
jgi:hypothetical protein